MVNEKIAASFTRIYCMNKKLKLLVILGSTSTGKTDLGIDLAKKLNGEIISADSRQVYKHLDIGTGKLPGEFETLKKENDYWEIDGIKIWMYDVLNPDKRFNLYEYISKTTEIIQKISEKGKLPILVGGTGLYIRSLVEGVSNFGKEANTDLRNELESLEIEKLKEKLNPDTLSKLNNSDLNNKRRLIRLIEMNQNPEASANPFPGLDKNYDILKIGLTSDRKIIRERIKKRVLKRIEQGMIKESKNLLDSGVLTFERMEELGLEYKYLSRYLGGEIKSLDEFAEILSTKIGQFAKRQETWFRKEKNVVWFDILEKDFTSKVEMRVLDWYNGDS